MKNNNTEQLQIRVDSKTKNEAKKILSSLGMDMSSAIKIFLHQVINTKTFPCELRGENGLTLRGSKILRESIADAEGSDKSFEQGKEIIKDALKD